MKLTETQIEIINLLSNDCKINEIGIYFDKGTSWVEKQIASAKEKNDIRTTYGLIGEYLNSIYFNKNLHNPK